MIGRFKLDLRMRIAVVLATVCIAVVGALGVTLYMASTEMEQRLVEQLVAEEMESLIARAKAPDSGPIVAVGPNLQYHVLRTPRDYAKLPPKFRNLGSGHHEIGSGMDESHVVVRDLGGVRYLVAYDAGPHELRQQRFRNLLWLALGAVVVVSVVLGYWLAGVLTRQLTELASRVSTFQPGEAHPPLARADHDAEVAALARALDQHHAQLVETIRREQEFTANASHELRTPLTAIRTSCELLATEQGLSEKGRSRLEMIDSAAAQMTERMEALLVLARRDLRDHPETVDLRECVAAAAMPWREEIARKGLAFEVPIREDAIVKLDRKALQLVLGNLIKNAVRYTERGYVRVTYEAPRLTVADSGSGIAPQHLAQVFDRHYRAEQSGDGLGLGLAIVRRICEDLGWKIEVQSKPGHGSAFSIVFA